MYFYYEFTLCGYLFISYIKLKFRNIWNIIITGAKKGRFLSLTRWDQKSNKKLTTEQKCQLIVLSSPVPFRFNEKEFKGGN